MRSMQERVERLGGHLRLIRTIEQSCRLLFLLRMPLGDQRSENPKLDFRLTFPESSSGLLECPHPWAGKSPPPDPLDRPPETKVKEPYAAEDSACGDHEGIRRRIRSVLEAGGFDVCGEAVNGSDAIEKTKALLPDLVILNLSDAGDERSRRDSQS